MGSVSKFPVVRTYPRYICTECGYYLFELADDKGQLIAVCAECETPTTTLSCPCMIDDKECI